MRKKTQKNKWIRWKKQKQNEQKMINHLVIYRR